ncbi:MAG TPA: dickkopf-related protein, partial [Polyangiales bacterium]
QHPAAGTTSSGKRSAGCVVDRDCDDGHYCNGAERCGQGVCSVGADPCRGQLCDELAGACSSARPEATITLVPETKFQTIVGWEAVPEAGENPADSGGATYAGYKDELLDAAVNDLGITRLRMPVPCGIEGRAHRYEIINDNADPKTIDPKGFEFSNFDLIFEAVVMPMKERVERNGEHLWLTLDYIANLDEGKAAAVANFHAQHAEEYAEFVLAVYQHVKEKYGVIADAWEVINEPDWQGKDFTGARIGAVILAAADLLRAHGFTPRFIAPSPTKASNATRFFEELSKVTPAASFVTELSYHRYSPAPTRLELMRINEVARAAHVGTSMLEHIGSGVDDLYEDLVYADAVAWEQYVLAYGGGADNGEKYYGIANPGTPQQHLQMQSSTKFLRQYFKFIRPGAVRIGVGSTQAKFRPVAFINKPGTMVTVVRAMAPGSFAIAGLREGRYGIKYTTLREYDVDLPDQTIKRGEPLLTQIPGEGCITIYSR